MSENLCIVGCGWLGQYVGNQLGNQFKEVYASCRSSETKNQLENLGFMPFIIDLESDHNIVPKNVIDNTSKLLIMLPPFRKGNPKYYGDQLRNLAIQFKPETKVIFISSTGVYPNVDGNYDENFADPESLLGYAENELLKLLKNRLIILRLGGLIGGQRHPIKYLSGKHMSTNGGEQVNLIHRQDISRLIDHIFQDKDITGIFNVSYPLNASKKEYYDHIATKLGIALPVWNSESGANRLISTEKIENLNGFNLIFNPLEFTFG